MNTLGALHSYAGMSSFVMAYQIYTGKRPLTGGIVVIPDAPRCKSYKKCFVHVFLCVCIGVGVIVSLFLSVRISGFLSETVFGSLASCQTPALRVL